MFWSWDNKIRKDDIIFLKDETSKEVLCVKFNENKLHLHVYIIVYRIECKRLNLITSHHTLFIRLLTRRYIDIIYSQYTFS